MADTISEKDDAAAQKAYETAVAAKSESQPKASADGADTPKAEPAPAPKAPAKEPAAKKSAALEEISPPNRSRLKVNQ